MYFFYFDESGSRDPSVGTPNNPKDHIYVLTAVGLHERKWFTLNKNVSSIKLTLAKKLASEGKGQFDLSECEVKSNWIRNPKEREKKSPFLHNLSEEDLGRLVRCFLEQPKALNAVVMTAVIDKRYLQDHLDHEKLHKKAYEFLLERIEHYITEYHRNNLALMVMDDTSKELNRAVAMKHAFFQRAGNQNMRFQHIVEYPFFTRSELSNGVQLADLIAYNIYRAFKTEDFNYSYFTDLWPIIYRRRDGNVLNGLKVWPDDSPLVTHAKTAWEAYKKENPPRGEGS